MDNGRSTWEGPFHPTPVSQASQQKWDQEESDNETTSSKLSYGQNSAAEVGDGQFLRCSLPPACPPPSPQHFREDGFLMVTWVRNHRSSGVFTNGWLQHPRPWRCSFRSVILFHAFCNEGMKMPGMAQPESTETPAQQLHCRGNSRREQLSMWRDKQARGR